MRIMDELNKLILHPDFERIVEELSRKNISLPPGDETHPLEFSGFGSADGRVEKLEEIKGYPLNADRGSIAMKEYRISAYDESIVKFDALEGMANFTSHSLVVCGETEYAPINLVTFYFYTRSQKLAGPYIKQVSDVERQANKDRVFDEKNFLLKYTPPKSLLFVDGPLIAGDYYTYMVDAMSEFLAKEIIPVFLVKNSMNNLITENIPELKGQFNSDLHWLYHKLKRGERSAFFKYEDQHNRKNAKVFCYVKAFDISPQRIEFHRDVFDEHRKAISSIMDIIYYLLLVQGKPTNPQVRPVAVAEMFARETLKFVDIHRCLREAKIVPTMNQVRFGG